jgi:hypothetical protein
MTKTRVIRKTHNIDKLIKKIRDLKKASVESGYFIEQGIHSTIDMPYTSLMATHEWGWGVPQRQARLSTFDVVTNSKSNKKELRNFLYTDQKLEQYLDKVGSRITMTAKGFFGQPSLRIPSNAPSKGVDSPLVDTGELKDAWSYRTSLNLSIRGL